jgi:hypothetical protein
MQPINSDICSGRDDVGCGGTIFPIAIDCRYFLYKEVFIPLPLDMKIPRCDKCKADWVDFDTEAALDVILNREYEKHEDMILEARRRFEEKT